MKRGGDLFSYGNVNNKSFQVHDIKILANNNRLKNDTGVS